MHTIINCVGIIIGIIGLSLTLFSIEDLLTYDSIWGLSPLWSDMYRPSEIIRLFSIELLLFI
ncbi:MAG: hypothetical protein QF415_07305, partial [Candidatus Undinarchaeales archaeon]|nr:hypothetical protein [Candidatus Undinarchaeales archaeon]